MAEKALKQPDLFIWTGTDKRGVKVKGHVEEVLEAVKAINKAE